MQTVPPPGTAPPAVTVAPPAPAPLPPGPHRSRSVLGRLVLSVAFVAVGVVALVDTAGAHVAASVYFAAPLAVVAAGLVVGAWYGRARGLIGAGIVLSVLLAITFAVDGPGWTAAHRTVTWRPTTIGQVQSTYRIDAGNAVLDLSRVDFAGQSRALDVQLSAGNLTVILPSTVDAEVHASVAVGDATVLGQRWSGIGQGGHAVTDNGTDGPGGGNLTVNATVNVGELEVRR